VNSPQRNGAAIALAAIILCAALAGKVLSQGKSVLVVLDATKERIEKTKKVNKPLLSQDRVLIANMFDDTGKLVTESPPPGSEKGKLFSAILKKDPEQPLQLTASAWYEIRVGKETGEKNVDKVITYAVLQNSIDNMVRLTVRSMPIGGKVYLRTEDNPVGLTEVKRWVSSGKLRVLVTLDGYEDFDQVIEVPDHNHVLTAKLKQK
jgi:PEGA domain